jgi:hypothetical protein
MERRDRPKPPLALAAGNLLSLALGLYVVLGQLSLWLRASRAPVSGIASLPSLPVYGTLAAALVTASAFALAALFKRKPAEARAYRLLPIAATLCAFMHWLVLTPVVPPIPADEIALAQMALARDDLATAQALPREAGPIEALLQAVPPPYLVRGERLARWNILVRTECASPWLEAPVGVRAGTFLYCLSQNGREAWITAVGSGGALLGEPALVTRRGNPVVARVESLSSGSSQDPTVGPANDVDASR